MANDRLNLRAKEIAVTRTISRMVMTEALMLVSAVAFVACLGVVILSFTGPGFAVPWIVGTVPVVSVLILVRLVSRRRRLRVRFEREVAGHAAILVVGARPRA